MGSVMVQASDRDQSPAGNILRAASDAQAGSRGPTPVSTDPGSEPRPQRREERVGSVAKELDKASVVTEIIAARTSEVVELAKR